MSTATIELVNNAAAVAAVQQKQQDVAISSNGAAGGALTSARAFASGLCERAHTFIIVVDDDRFLSVKELEAPPPPPC